MADTPGEAAVRRRGRPPRDQEAKPTGYRATVITRRQLEMARQFTGHGSLQAIIDTAVRRYLVRLATDAPAYRSALEGLDPRLADDLQESHPEAEKG